MSCHTTGILAAVWREIFAPILTEIIQRLASLFRCESKIDILGDVERRKLYKLEILIRCASKTRDIVGPYSILWYLFFDQWEDLHLVDLHIATKIWLWDEMKKLSHISFSLHDQVCIYNSPVMQAASHVCFICRRLDGKLDGKCLSSVDWTFGENIDPDRFCGSECVLGEEEKVVY